jgi:hypothetical protein
MPAELFLRDGTREAARRLAALPGVTEIDRVDVSEGPAAHWDVAADIELSGGGRASYVCRLAGGWVPGVDAKLELVEAVISPAGSPAPTFSMASEAEAGAGVWVQDATGFLDGEAVSCPSGSGTLSGRDGNVLRVSGVTGSFPPGEDVTGAGSGFASRVYRSYASGEAVSLKLTLGAGIASAGVSVRKTLFLNEMPT